MGPAIFAILCMLALGFVTKYSGMDAVLGLAFTRTGRGLYPIFGTLLGWLGVALTGSDTSSNVLFGNLQKVTALKLKLNPILMASANSTGGVMGKMIDAQSIVVAAAATGEGGREGDLLRADDLAQHRPGLDRGCDRLGLCPPLSGAGGFCCPLRRCDREGRRAGRLASGWVRMAPGGNERVPPGATRLSVKEPCGEALGLKEETWPDRSALTPAVREGFFHRGVGSLTRVRGFRLARLPGLGRFLSPQCSFEGFGIATDVHVKGERVAIRGPPAGHNPTELAWNDDVSSISTWLELRWT